MEEKLREILERYENEIASFEVYNKELISKMRIYKKHNLNEEYRIANLKCQTISMCLYQFRAMYAEVQELLNAWEG